MDNLFAFLSYIFITAFTPGPNNLMAMMNATRNGFLGGLRFNAGVFLGFLFVMGLCAVLGSLMGRLMPAIEPVMCLLGAGYIIWLAWTMVRGKSHTGKRFAPEGGVNSIRTGAVLQLVNPKLIIYGVTSLSTFVLPHYPLKSLPAFVLVLSLVGFMGTCCWAMFGSFLQGVFERHSVLVNAVMALLLVYCGASLVLSAFPG